MDKNSINVMRGKGDSTGSVFNASGISKATEKDNIMHVRSKVVNLLVDNWG